MSAPQFQTILFVHEDVVRLFYLPQKNWHALDDSADLSEPVPASMREKLADKNVLVLISDSYCGHLQFSRDNKKSQLTQEAITQVLADDYEIDIDAYELSWQNFTLSRQLVQLSVSGVEKEVLVKIQQWLDGTGAKKTWVMPFAWFLSTLKSVDPALIALLIDDNIHVSHHYLGIDDARVLEVNDLDKYVKARQKERKETHLIYLQTPARKRKAIDKQLSQAEISSQSLLSESSDDVLLDVIQATLSKGQEAIAQLLHFEFEVTPVVVATAAGESVTSDLPEPAAPAASASSKLPPSDLPRPEPPASLRNSVEIEDEVDDLDDQAESELEDQLEDASASVKDPKAAAALAGAAVASELSEVAEVESTEVEPEAKTKSQKNQAEKTSKVVEEDPQLEPVESDELTQEMDDEEVTKAAAEPENKTDQIFASLKDAGVHSNNGDRYAQVEEKRSWKGPILVFFSVMILTAVIGGGIFWSQEGTDTFLSLFPNFRDQSPVQLASPTPEPTIEPSPPVEATQSAELEEEESVEEIDKTTPKIVVLNATGIAGLAGRVRTQLLQAGWENVSVGNASGTYSDATFIQTESAELISVLSEDLDRELKETTNLSESQVANNDVVIVLAEE